MEGFELEKLVDKKLQHLKCFKMKCRKMLKSEIKSYVFEFISGEVMNGQNLGVKKVH